ncbi:MAG: glycosyltransferase, partial [Anaerolineae bacterium]|nr:glycosyltransferase [Anaerolineae bacterium]
MKPVLSIIAPIYNEEDCLHELHRRITEVMEKFGDSWELVLVNDGSKDRSDEIIHELANKDPEHVKPV